VENGALFSQENVPSETMFYSVLNSQKDGDIEKLENKLNAEKNLLQIGANATTGLGWCSVAMKEVK
jgi:CRISPR/Cas system CMR subunit Cmr4 (Cas7 group RAMP superfamily)